MDKSLNALPKESQVKSLPLILAVLSVSSDCTVFTPPSIKNLNLYFNRNFYAVISTDFHKTGIA